MDEITVAYQTVGVMLRARIKELCNEHRFIEAEELQKGYNIINEYTDDSLTWEEVKETKAVSELRLKRRTPEEMKAYVEGYNACNEMFRKYLKQEGSVKNAIDTMDVIVAAVNGVIDREVNE